jgi:galactokinase
MDQQQREQRFVERFGGAHEVAALAPGRVNLIGEHTDYHEGFVFPAAIGLGLHLLARPTSGKTTLHSLQLGDAEPFKANEVEPGDSPSLGWARFPAGMAWAMREAGYGPLPDLEILVDSEVPIGGGVSSSAALEMALGVVWRHFLGKEIDGLELARIGRRAENGFVGKASGIMDQTASAMGREGCAMFLDTRHLQIQYAPLPRGLEIVICDTRVSHAGQDDSYNSAREQGFEAARKLGISVLRDATMADLESVRSDLTDEQYRAAKHVVTENARCKAFYEALLDGDRAEMGALMEASHESLRVDYRVSCEELDAMAEAARSQPGCIGARMTGGGFGGACVALVESASVPAFVHEVSHIYGSRFGFEPRIVPTCAAKGAHLLPSRHV